MRTALSILVMTVLLGIPLWPRPAPAAMIPLRLEQLSQDADVIVLGIVLDQVSAWNTARSAIYTTVTVEVEEAVKGTPGSTVTFHVAGGVVGDIGMRTSTDPTFQIGERVFVFLRSVGGTVQLVGLKQGKFAVDNDAVLQQGQSVTVNDFKSAVRAIR